MFKIIIIFTLYFSLFAQSTAQSPPDFAKVNAEIKKHENEAENLYKRGIKFSPRFFDSTFFYADKLILNGKINMSDSSRILGQILRGRGFYNKRMFDSAKVIFKDVISEIRDKENFSEFYFSSKNLYGLSLWHAGEFQNAKIIFEQLITEFQSSGDQNLKAGVYGNLGILNKMLGDFLSAINDFEQSIKYGGKDKFFIANSFLNIGTIYTTLKEYGRADESFNSAIQIKDIPTSFRVSILNNKSQNFLKWHKADSAESSMRKAINLFENLPPAPSQIFPLTGLGKIEMERGNAQKSEKLFLRASKIAEKLRDRTQKLIVGISLLELEFFQNKYSSVIDRGLKIIASAEGTRNEPLLKNCYKKVSQSFEAIGEIENAHLYMKKHAEFLSRMNNFAGERASVEAVAKYSLYKMKTEVGSYKSIVKNNYIFIGILSAGGVLFILLFVLAFRKYKGEREFSGTLKIDMKKQEEKIREMNKKLEELNSSTMSGEKNFLFVEKSKVLFGSIIYIQSSGHYLNYFLKGKKSPLLERKNISEVWEELPKNQFVRIHRSTIINLLFLESFTSTEVVLSDGSILKVSRTYKNELQNAVCNLK